MSDKLLAEFCGMCWHEWRTVNDGREFLRTCTNCNWVVGTEDLKELDKLNPDFISPNGIYLLYREMGEKGEWASFYKFNHNKNYVNGHSKDWHSVKFHELTDLTKKRDLIAEYLKEVK